MRKLCTLLLALILIVCTFAACASSQAGNFESRKQKIEKAWLAKDGTELVWDSPDAAGARYYGTYNGYDIVFIPKPTNRFPIMNYLMFSAEVVFTAREPFRLYAYKDGEFRGLFYAHRDGLISDEQISEIAAAHRAYQDQKNNTDAAN